LVSGLVSTVPTNGIFLCAAIAMSITPVPE
jgi:hypothetical protein